MRCLVTDRRRLAKVGASVDDALRLLLAQLEEAVKGGVDLIQVRERDLDAAHLAALVRDVVSLARGSRTRVVINDRLDVALACGAGGVHLRGDSIPALHARRIAPPAFLIGRSVHAADEVPATEGCDYLIAGTVFSSRSKAPDAPLLGLAGLQAIVRAARVPVLAIGGVTPDRFDEITAAGAAGVAGIGLFLPFDSPKPPP
jgi:thiamine-phosphate pyrophosphorylase